MKTLLVLWLLTNRSTVTFQYAIKFDTEQQCLSEASKHLDKREGMFMTYPIKNAECIPMMELKK